MIAHVEVALGATAKRGGPRQLVRVDDPQWQPLAVADAGVVLDSTSKRNNFV